MLLTLLFALQSPAPAAPPAQKDQVAQVVTDQELAERFPAAWRLPRADQKGRALPWVQFEDSLSQLLERPLQTADPNAGRPALNLGDLLARAAQATQAATPAAGRQQLDRLLREAEAIVPAASWPQVRALLDRRDALAPKWDPEDDDARAGFLIGPSWELPADCWPEHDGSRSVEQCAVFVAADQASLKACEWDFARYLTYPGNSYRSVAPVPGSYAYVHPAAGPRNAGGLICAATTTLEVDFDADLPFPFSGYALRLHYLSNLDDRGRPRTWVYSDSSAFHWLAGCDLYQPVHDAAGAFVGTLIVRQCGADLDGVPDRASHRQAGMRVALGGLRRDAEQHFRLRNGAEAFPALGALPVCPIPVPGP